MTLSQGRANALVPVHVRWHVLPITAVAVLGFPFGCEDLFMSVLAERFDVLRDVLEDAERVVVTGHARADGDAVGAVAALRRYCELEGKDVVALLNEPLSPRYTFMTFERKYEIYDPARHDEVVAAADVIIMCDLAAPERLGRIAPAFDASPAKKICIDHHPWAGTADGPVDINLIDADATATGRIVWDYIQHVEGRVDREIAESVFVSLCTDTGWFRYPNTDASVLKLAAELAQHHLDLPAMHRAIYQCHSAGVLRLLGHVTRSMNEECDGRFVWTTVRREFLRDLEVEHFDVDPILDVLRAGGKVRAVALFTELDDGGFAVSLRSYGDPDVNGIARLFGGGGHTYAAGLTLGPEHAQTQMAELIDTVRRGVRAMAHV